MVFEHLDSAQMSTRSIQPNPDRRRHQRILVPNGRVIRAIGSAGGARGEVRNEVRAVVTIIGLGGVFLRTEISYPTGTHLHLTFDDSHVTFESECIVRNIEPNGVGAEFTTMTHENALKLKSLLSSLKT